MKKEFRTKIYIVVMMLGMVAIFWYLLQTIQNNPMNVMNLSEGWMVTCNDTTEENIDLLKYAFKDLQKGDVVTLRNTIPDTITTGMQIRVFTAYAVMNVYIAGKEEYHYGYGFSQQDRIVPGTYHNIELVKAHAGKEIMIKYQVKDPDPFTILPAIYIGDTEGISGKFIQDNMFPLCVGVILTLVGSLLSVITCLLALKKASIAIIFYAANFALLMGLWSLADMYVLNVIINNPEATYVIKYITLYLCPISIVMIFRELNLSRAKWRRIFLCCAIVDYIFCAVTFTMAYLNLFHINESLLYLHLLIVVEIGFAFGSVFSQFNIQSKKERYLTVGLTAFVLLVALDMFRFNLDLYASTFGLDIHLMSSVMPFGALIFLVCIFLCYAFDVTDQRKAEEERNRLQELAYRDRLTNLYNRQKCDEILKEKRNEKADYTIINFDLNELKYLNDTKGHLYGDMLISGFAKILLKIFHGKKDIIGRMGGDEFIAILSTIDRNEIKKSLKALNELMHVESENGEIKYSCAYGFACSDEVSDGNTMQEETQYVYELADTRMYEMKRRQKETTLHDTNEKEEDEDESHDTKL